MTIKVSIAHVSWRRGRPRFEPGPALRAMGYEGRDLKDSAGRWLDLEAAGRFSEALLAEVAQRRAIKAATGRMAPKPRAGASDAPKLTTVEALFDAWFQHPSMALPLAGRPQPASRPGLRVKAPATIVSYRKFMKVMAEVAPEIFGAFAGALDKVIVFRLYERLIAARGLATANAVIRTLSAAISFGIRRGLVPLAANPCEKLGMQSCAPRLRIAERADIAALVAAADALQRPEIGDAILLGVWTGQRQADRLQLQDEGLLNSRRIFRQQKTGALVAIPESPALAQRLALAKERRASHVISWREFVINERDRRPWKPDHYRHVFGAIVVAASAGVLMVDGQPVLALQAAKAKGALKYLPGLRGLTAAEARRLNQAAPDYLIAATASLDGFRDQDLRDTAVTWLALAGCTIPEICAVTGHEPQSATSILKHYLARHPELADHAIAKLVAWHG
jgi:hypothetical protein